MKARRWSDTAAFRADPAAAPSVRPSRRQTVGLLVVLLLVAGAAAAASYLVRPDKARAFDLVHGSVFLEDNFAPVGIDLASGKPTIRLVNAAQQVGASNTGQLSVVPLQNSTLLLNKGGPANSNSGEFNGVDQTGFVLKPDGSGVTLNSRADETTSVGFPAGGDTAAGSAYIERTGDGGTDVFLVNQLTINNAANPSKKVEPRASIFLAPKASTGPGSGAGANGDLWVLLGTGSARTVTQLTVPPDSHDGAKLTRHSHGLVDQHAAIGVADETGSGNGSVVGVAEPTRIALYRPGSTKPTITLTPGVHNVDSILPADNQGDRLNYLLHADDGWSLISIRSDGQDFRRDPLPDLTASALVRPAQSGDALYTVDRTNGEIYQIDLAGAGKATAIRGYPTQTSDASTFDDAQVVTRGPRVIVNSPGHGDAVVLFTDGSHDPLVIRKIMAVSVSAAASATTFATDKSGQTSRAAKPKGSSGAQPKSQPVSTRVDCKTVNQKPHRPAITGATPGSRSVALAWTYPLLDQQDCVPSTYRVTVKLLSNDAPQPKGFVDVQGQQSVNLAGLYPSSRYALTVTASLNKLTTTSNEVVVTTGPEGPAAPTGVTATADSAGNWTVRWSGCGAVAQGCVPAASWRVIPSFCDGVGLSGAPTPLDVPADPSTKVQAPVLYKGNDALLGRGLRFQIEGTGQQGTAGTPSAQSACVYSTAPPNVAAMTLNASTAASSTALGASTTANVTLNLGANPTRDVGGYGAKITITLTGPGDPQTRSFVFNGNQTVLSTNFSGVQAGALYSASATVTPAHGGGTASIAPKTLQTRANWPDISLSATCPSTGLLTCTPSIRIGGISSAAANGERFSFEGTIACKSLSAPIGSASFDPGAGPITGKSLSQTADFYGTCKVDGTLQESSDRKILVFGGSVKDLHASIDLPGPTLLKADKGDFSASWNGATVTVVYTGDNKNVAALTTGNFTATVVAPGSHDCGTNSDSYSSIKVLVPDTCLLAYGGTDGWTVTVGYNDAAGHGTPTVPDILLGRPTYVPPQCDVSGLSAAWKDTQAGGIGIGNSGNDIRACGDFKYSLLDSGGTAICGDSTASGPPPATIIYTNCATPPAAGWKVHVTYTDAAHTSKSIDLTVSNGADPPAN